MYPLDQPILRMRIGIFEIVRPGVSSAFQFNSFATLSPIFLAHNTLARTNFMCHTPTDRTAQVILLFQGLLNVMFGYRKPSTPTVTRSKVEEPRARTQSPRTSSTEDFFCSKAKYDDCEEHQVLLASTIAVVIYRFLLRPQLFDTVTRRIWTDYVCIVSSTTDAYGLKMFVSSAPLLPCVLQTWPLVTCAQHEDLQHSCLDHCQTQQARADFTVIVKLMTHLDHGSPMLTGMTTKKCGAFQMRC